ncbi:MAG: peptide chain release factor 2 [Parachlamydiales bacterium]|nr:peptide chain release factor 2 [Parachlamydiales bacterium]
MNQELEQRIKSFKERLVDMWRYLDLASKEAKVNELDEVMASNGFWDDQVYAQKIISESNALKTWTVPYADLKERFSNIDELLPEAYDAQEEEMVQDLLIEFTAIEKELESLEVKRMLSGELDAKNCYLSINSGAGGTEACDWALMLSRMYERWASDHKWKIDMVDRVDGEVAGIKNVTYKIQGPYAYGYAKAEKGVHRLVRISPFDSNARRHTSFASVEITPEIEDDIVVEIKPDDIRVDTYRASGAGGQHVNKTDSAVRITHMPTNIVVSCQSERSQIQNRESCMKMLRSKLYEKEVIERENAIKALAGEKKDNAWGSQIRNYVFQPYTLVKDTRTGYETGNVHAMMDGDLLDEFIVAYLKEFGN